MCGRPHGNLIQTADFLYMFNRQTKFTCGSGLMVDTFKRGEKKRKQIKKLTEKKVTSFCRPQLKGKSLFRGFNYSTVHLSRDTVSINVFNRELHISENIVHVTLPRAQF